MSAGDKFLSVIIPVHNTGKYLARCLDSVAAMPIEDLEIILVDDGSDDGSGTVCDRYRDGDARFRVIHQDNLGVSTARNTGLTAAVGEVVAFFDSDDYISPGDFFDVTEKLRADPAMDFLITDFDRVTEEGIVRERIRQIRETDEPMSGYVGRDEFFVSGENFWNVWRCVFRRSFLLEHGLDFDRGVSCAEDLKFMVRAFLCAENAVFWHKPFYHYMVNYGATLSFTYSYQRMRDVISMLRWSLEQTKKGDGFVLRMTDILTHEFFLNLPLLRLVPEEERTAVKKLLEDNLDLLLYSQKRVYPIAYSMIRILGLPLSCRILYVFKACKSGFKTLRQGKGQRQGGNSFVQTS